ncbi:hypothetical protein OIU84_004737 [Salix udensis]|uniref:Uncharacterized protein n=1 Tax=Salix udensis TaxID=889485 RepID=A0AAD6K502_9ROSI|nr:hypothetical protein OIU84_004737 [Salix udensis]
MPVVVAADGEERMRWPEGMGGRELVEAVRGRGCGCRGRGEKRKNEEEAALVETATLRWYSKKKKVGVAEAEQSLSSYRQQHSLHLVLLQILPRVLQVLPALKATAGFTAIARGNCK